MNYKNKANSLLHQSSLKLIRTALSIALSRVVSNEQASAQNCHAGVTTRHLKCKTFESNAPVRVPKENSLLRFWQLKNNSGQSISNIPCLGNLSNFRISDEWPVLCVRNDYGSIDLSDSSTKRGNGNKMNALRKPNCHFHGFPLISARKIK